MKYIYIAGGKKIIVDDDDFSYLNRFNWSLQNNDVVRQFEAYDRPGQHVITMRMKSLITNYKQGHYVTHRNGDRFDFRKENLMHVPFSTIQHKRGKIKSIPTSSKYKGVSFDKSTKNKLYAWRAYIVKDGKRYSKRHSSEKEAALWYNEKAVKLFGAYAYQNKIKT